MSIRPLNSELAEKACEELNEDPKRTSSDIQHIKEWLSKQPHLRARTGKFWSVKMTYIRPSISIQKCCETILLN